MTTSDIAARIQADYVAVRLSFEPWLPARKKPRGSTQHAMAQAAGVEAESVSSALAKYNVRIPSIKAINAVRTAARAYVETVTVFGQFTALRFLPRADLLAFENRMDLFRRDLIDAAARVQADRQAIIDDAQRRLNGEFDPADYPADLSTLFGISWDYPSVAVAEGLPTEIQEQQQTQLETQLGLDAERVELALLEEFQDVATHLASVLKPEPGAKPLKWHANTLVKVQEFRDRVERLSILQTPWLRKAVEDAYAIVSDTTAQALKDNPTFAANMASLLNAVILRSGPNPVRVAKPQGLDHEALCPTSAPIVI